MKIDITLPPVSETQSNEFGWPMIQDPVGSPKTTVVEFYDAGTELFEITDFEIPEEARTIHLLSNYSDLIRIGSELVMEYQELIEGEWVIKKTSRTVNEDLSVVDASTFAVRVGSPLPDNITKIEIWKDCSDWSGALTNVFEESTGPYNFLSYWGHPTYSNMKVYANESSQVPTTTIEREFTQDDDGEWLKRKPLGSIDASLDQRDEDLRWRIGNGFFNINMRLKKDVDQEREDNSSRKLECDLDLLKDSETKWKTREESMYPIQYKRTGLLGSYHLEIKETGTGSIAHYFKTYATGTDGESILQTKYMAEAIERTIKDNEGQDVREPISLFYCPFDTSDPDNFKMTLEPSYDADEYLGKPIVGGKKYKVLLMPRRWAYYTRVRETTIGEEIIQASATSVRHYDPDFTGGWSGSHVSDFDVTCLYAYSQDSFIAQGPMQHRFTFTGSHIPEGNMTEYTQTDIATLYAKEWHQEYRVGIWWDRFPNQITSLRPAEEEKASTLGLYYATYFHDPAMSLTNATPPPPEPLEYYLLYLYIPPSHLGDCEISTMGDWTKASLEVNYPLASCGLNAWHLTSFWYDEEYSKHEWSGGFLRPLFILWDRIVENIPHNGGWAAVDFDGYYDTEGLRGAIPTPEAQHRMPFQRSNQRVNGTIVGVSYLSSQVPIFLGAFHSPSSLKWQTYDSVYYPNYWADCVWYKIAGAPPAHIDQMATLDNPSSDDRWIPSLRASSFWTDHGLPIYNLGNDYSKWTNIPMGIGISPDKAESLVGMIVIGSKVVYVWRKIDEDLSLHKVELPNEEPFSSQEDYSGHFQSFETTMESGYSHCNEYGYFSYYLRTHLSGGSAIEGNPDYIGNVNVTVYPVQYRKPILGRTGWADEMEYEFIDQFTGSGTRKLTHVGRNSTTEAILLKDQCTRNPGVIPPTASWNFLVETSLDLLEDYRIIASGAQGQHALDTPIFVMYSKERQIDIPTEKGTFSTFWPYPKGRVARNNFGPFGDLGAYPDDPDDFVNNCNPPNFTL